MTAKISDFPLSEILKAYVEGLERLVCECRELTTLDVEHAINEEYAGVRKGGIRRILELAEYKSSISADKAELLETYRRVFGL